MYRELQHYKDALRTYITSTYHISNPALVDMRDEFLRRIGAIAQEPYLGVLAQTADFMHQWKRRLNALNTSIQIRRLLS